MNIIEGLKYLIVDKTIKINGSRYFLTKESTSLFDSIQYIHSLNYECDTFEIHEHILDILINGLAHISGKRFDVDNENISIFGIPVTKTK